MGYLDDFNSAFVNSIQNNDGFFSNLGYGEVLANAGYMANDGFYAPLYSTDRQPVCFCFLFLS